MNQEKRAHKQAAAESKRDGARYVVYVYDEGYSVYTRDQARIYAPMILIEALYFDGVKVASHDVAEKLVAL